MTLTPMMIVGLLAVMTPCFVTGAMLLARAAKTNEPLWLAFAYCFYMAGNSVFYILVRHGGLGVMTTFSAVAQTLAVLLVAKLVLGEALTAQKLVGMAIAIVGVTIVMLPPLVSK